MMLIEIHRAAPQIPETGVEGVGQVLTTCHRSRRELRGNQNFLALSELAEPALRGTPAVHRRGVEEIHLRSEAGLERRLLISRIRSAVRALGRHEPLCAEGLSPDHDSQADSRNANITAAQHRCLSHRPLLRLWHSSDRRDRVEHLLEIGDAQRRVQQFGDALEAVGFVLFGVCCKVRGER